ncbi:putative bifunctional diguanylate cyclase/phosphodiesterase [Belnapia moabensis]|uniref:putative bifunctional diguanylate cyclase/phosphodiesterase n=1 Tax=Belnapia moabensis TaxID=365533 RepID=UPI000693F131|nr:EAL domain-containing protein [Belnapia moabensis]
MNRIFERAIRRAEATGIELTLNEQTLEGFSDGIAIADLALHDHPLIYVNSAFERITGYRREDLLGRNCRFLQGTDRTQPAIHEMAQAIAEGRDIGVVLRNFHRDGTPFWNELRLRPLRDAEGRVTHYLAIMRDVTALRDLNDQLVRTATFDEVTGLLTGRGLLDRLAMLETAEPVLMLCCDVDQLRDVNATYGRSAGDILLRELGRRLGAAPGLVAASRLGAGQFAAALHRPAEPEAAIATLHAALRQPFTLPGATVSLTVTIGWAEAAWAPHQAEPLLIEAEAALYAAKAAGHGERRAFDPAVERDARRRLRMTADLRHALANREFVLHYQPKVELATGRITGLEALLRWHNPVFGLQSPDRFLPVAEQSGLIVEIGAWALAEAARTAAELHRRGHAIQVAVNVSPVQFHRDDVPALLRRILAETGAEPGWISVELTETVLADRTARTLACFRALREMGIGLAMDDFGTGFASLDQLRSLPFTEVKLDRSFVRNLDADPVQAAIVTGTLGVAHALGITATCEGVETEAERERLVALGCPVAQGYLFSLPLAKEDLFWLLEKHAVLPVAAE